MRTRDEVLQLIDEARSRIAKAGRKGFQAGGAYWRLAKALEFVDAELNAQEGYIHAEKLRITHGRIVKSS